MADEAGEKTESPTPRRRSEARESGQVAKSQDLSAAVLLLGTLIALYLFGRGIWHTLTSVMRHAIGSDSPPGIDTTVSFGSKVFVEVFKAVAPLFIVVMVVGLVVLYSQVGWLFTLKPLTPNLDKLNPLNGFKRLFSSQTVVQLAQNVAKLALVGFVAWLSVKSVINKLLLIHTVDLAVTLPMAAGVVFQVALRLAIVLLLLAIVDFFYQRYRHEKQLKMTKEEVKEEMKRMEGDPVVKRRRREVQLKLALERLKSTVPQADVVVANPTHFAVAIRYAPEEMAAPKVIAKGADYMARRIRELALSSGVPIVQKPQLARRLYSDVEVGFEIPERFYRAVAEILAYVYELSGKQVAKSAVPVG